MLLQNKINLRYCASGWFYCTDILRCTVLQTSNSFCCISQATTNLRNTCTIRHTGTSAAAPLAAGIIALALEVKYVTVCTITITIINIIIIIIIIILLSFRLSQTLWFLTKIPVLPSLDYFFLPSMLLIQPNLFHILTIYIYSFIHSLVFSP